MQIIVTLNNRDGFIIFVFLLGGGGVNQKIDAANNRDGFNFYSRFRETNNHDDFIHRLEAFFLHTFEE